MRHIIAEENTQLHCNCVKHNNKYNVKSCYCSSDFSFLSLHSCVEETMRARVVLLLVLLAMAFVATYGADEVSSTIIYVGSETLYTITKQMTNRK